MPGRTYSARVERAFSVQSTLAGHGEHCSADPTSLAAIGRARGHQIRVRRSDRAYAIYTVSDVRAESTDHVVRMALAARERLGTTDEFDTIVDARVANPTITDAEAEACGELVERLDDDGAQHRLVVIAPHGGMIEPYTDAQAERLASRLADHGVSSWRCKGWRPGGGAYARWHITSTELHEASFPLLARIIDRRFTYAVAFHGFEEADVLIGGTAPLAVKQEIKEAIEAVLGGGIAVRIAQHNERYAGDDPRNVVNRLAPDNGVQIEQAWDARRTYWQAITDAVASVYARRLASSEPRSAG